MINISFYQNEKDQYELSLKSTDWIYERDSIDIVLDIESMNLIGHKIIQILSPTLATSDIPEDERSLEYQGHIIERDKCNNPIIKPLNPMMSDLYFRILDEESERLYTLLLVYKWYCDFQLDKAIPNKLNTEIILGYCFELITELGMWCE